MKISSVYSGYIHASTGVASVLIAMDEGNWSDSGLKHRIFSIDNKGRRVAPKQCSPELLSQKRVSYFKRCKLKGFRILSLFRQKFWKAAEHYNVFAVAYLSIFHKVRAFKLVKEFIADSSYNDFIIVHDIWSLLAFNSSEYDLKKVVFVIHGSDDPMSFLLKIFPKLEGSKFLSELSNDFTQCMHQLKSVVVLSAENKIKINEQYKVKSSLILNGIGDESYKLPIEDSLTVHMTGSICARKRQYLFVEVINTLGFNFLKSNNVKVNFFGGGPDYNFLLSKVKEYGLSPWVILHGDTEFPFKKYRLGDLILCISTEEGLPVALIEGLRAGCIPIVTNVGGCKLTTLNDNGLVLPSMSDDSVSLELRSLISMLSKHNNRRKMGMNSVELFKKEFSNQKMVDEYAKEILA